MSYTTSGVNVLDYKGETIATCNNIRNARRVAEVMSACENVADPKSFVKAARDLVDGIMLNKPMSVLNEYMEIIFKGVRI